MSCHVQNLIVTKIFTIRNTFLSLSVYKPSWSFLWNAGLISIRWGHALFKWQSPHISSIINTIRFVRSRHKLIIFTADTNTTVMMEKRSTSTPLDVCAVMLKESWSAYCADTLNSFSFCVSCDQIRRYHSWCFPQYCLHWINSIFAQEYMLIGFTINCPCGVWVWCREWTLASCMKVHFLENIVLNGSWPIFLISLDT